jgi:uncharacterized membrane protein YuzA (DUF378 family)
MKTIDVIATVLLIFGGLNWGLVGIAELDLVAAVFGLQFGQVSVLTSLVYLLVGLAAVYKAVFWRALQRRLPAHPAHGRAA